MNAQDNQINNKLFIHSVSPPLFFLFISLFAFVLCCCRSDDVPLPGSFFRSFATSLDMCLNFICNIHEAYKSFVDNRILIHGVQDSYPLLQSFDS